MSPTYVKRYCVPESCLRVQPVRGEQNAKRVRRRQGEDLKAMGKVNPERGIEITNYDSVLGEREGELNQERQKKSRTEPER